MPFDELIVLGDSLSDSTGNLQAETGGAIPANPAYVGGNATNGPLWVDYLSANLGGLPVTNYAVVGALSGSGNFFGPAFSGVSEQLATLSTTAPLSASAMYIVWAGSNDLLSITDPADAPTVIENAVMNMVNTVATLAMLGATQITVPDLANLGLTPLATLTGSQAEFTGLAVAYNNALNSALDDLSLVLGFDILRVGIFNASTAVISNPAAYGFGNASDACYVGASLPLQPSISDPAPPASICADASTYLFWDEVHPTTGLHAIIADVVQAAIVPVPATISLLAFGLAGLCFHRRVVRA